MWLRMGSLGDPRPFSTRPGSKAGPALHRGRWWKANGPTLPGAQGSASILGPSSSPAPPATLLPTWWSSSSLLHWDSSHSSWGAGVGINYEEEATGRVGPSVAVGPKARPTYVSGGHEHSLRTGGLVVSPRPRRRAAVSVNTGGSRAGGSK